MSHRWEDGRADMKKMCLVLEMMLTTGHGSSDTRLCKISGSGVSSAQTFAL